VQLTDRDLLALAFTGYASQRAMARELGVSHQKLGRWLKGESAIPADSFTRRGIETFFTQHNKRVQKWAKAQGVPYIGPVMLDRRPLDKVDPKTGRPILGDRVVIHNTQFITQAVRDAIIAAAHGAGRATGTNGFMGVSVKSVVDLYSYFKRAEVNRPTGAVSRVEQNEFRAQLAHKMGAPDFVPSMWTPANTQTNRDLRSPIYTKITSLHRARPVQAVIDDLNAKIRHKHEPATVKPGTVLASEILLQLYPADYVAPASKRGYKGPRPRTQASASRGTVRTPPRKGRKRYT
jgi:hypothetical protein